MPQIFVLYFKSGAAQEFFQRFLLLSSMTRERVACIEKRVYERQCRANSERQRVETTQPSTINPSKDSLILCSSPFRGFTHLRLAETINLTWDFRFRLKNLKLINPLPVHICAAISKSHVPLGWCPSIAFSHIHYDCGSLSPSQCL